MIANPSLYTSLQSLLRPIFSQPLQLDTAMPIGLLVASYPVFFLHNFVSMKCNGSGIRPLHNGGTHDALSDICFSSIHNLNEKELMHVRAFCIAQAVSVTYLDLLLLHLKISRRCLPLHAHLPSEKQMKRLDMINEM